MNLLIMPLNIQKQSKEPQDACCEGAAVSNKYLEIEVLLENRGFKRCMSIFNNIATIIVPKFFRICILFSPLLPSAENRGRLNLFNTLWQICFLKHILGGRICVQDNR